MAKTKDNGTATLFAEDAVQAEKPKISVATKRAVATRVQKNEVVVAPPSNLIASLYTAISDPKCQPEKLHALLDGRDRLMREQAEVEFMEAYIRLQSKLPSISRDGKIDHGTTKSNREGVKARYATYENINQVVRPILAEEKFGMLMLPDVMPDGAGIMIRGRLVYVCQTDYGKIVHSVNCSVPVPAEVSGGKNAAQGVGSSASYGKRYAAIALLNIVSHAKEDRDDDARRNKATVIEHEVLALTPDQVKKLKAEIEDCGVGESIFCNKYDIEKVEALPPTQFAEAITACKAFKAKRAPAGQATREQPDA